MDPTRIPLAPSPIFCGLARTAREFARDRVAAAAAAALALIAATALAAPWFAPQNPYDLAQLDLLDARLPPGARASTGITLWLGSDDQGRDLGSAILYGLRISLAVGLGSVSAALALGTAVGLVSAHRGGWLDAALMRLVDLQLSFPSILVALVLLAVLGPGPDRIVLALVVAQWAYFARTARALSLSELRREYVEAARCMGFGAARILARHVLPNVAPPLAVLAAVQVAHAIALEATLSFLGLGLPITEPSLGLLIANGFAHLLAGRYWISFFPGLALLATIVALNLVADRLRELLDPRAALHWLP